MSTALTIAWIGGGYLDRTFEEHGFDVRRIPFFTPRALDWREVCKEAGCKPDIVLYADASLPPPLVGVERFPCLTLFYCVDSHIHEWYPLYAQGFDLCAVSLRDHIPRMHMRLLPKYIFWLPPFPIRGERIPAVTPKRIWDVLFVGSVNEETTPGRKRFLQEFTNRLPHTKVRRGSFAELFPQAHVVINIAERGDLNFRVFEALATGACLLTPDIKNGQDLLFEDGVHLFTYELNNPHDAAEKAANLLADPELCERARRAGLAEIDAHHRRHHRMQLILDRLSALDRESVVRDRLQQADSINEEYMRLVYLHWAEAVHDASLRQRYLDAARVRTVKDKPNKGSFSKTQGG